MAQIFTSNQVNQVYVATALKTSNGKVAKSDAVGTISVQHDVEGNMYFMHKGQGGLTRSDLITNIMDIRYTPGPKMGRKRNAAFIEVNSSALSSSNVIAGQDYILRIAFQNPIGMSPDHGYWKHGVVHTTSSMSKNDFLLKMAESLGKNFAREAVQLLDMYIVATVSEAKKFFKINLDGTVSTTATDGSTSIYSSGTTYRTLDGIQLEEADNAAWRLGVNQDKPLVFRINHSTITRSSGGSSVEIYWDDVTYSNGKKVTGGEVLTESMTTAPATAGTSFNNSHLAAELEYFAMGERADLYRGIGWPDVRETEYIVKPTWAYGYDMINIHYAYVGSNHAVQKSEKDITILVPRASTDNDSTDELNAIGALTASIKGYIDAIVNPEDSRYLTSAKLFTGDSYTNGNKAAIAKASDGTLSIEDAGS